MKQSKTWLIQKQILLKPKELLHAIGTRQYDDMNGYDTTIKATGVQLDAKEKKQLIAAVSWKNPKTENVIKKVHKGKSDRVYGLFAVDGKVVEYKPGGELQDHENIALATAKPKNEINEAYFTKEVFPHVSETWIDASKKGHKDGEVGIVGYEIPFNRHFYVYQPPQDLQEIDADLDKVSAEIMNLLREVRE